MSILNNQTTIGTVTIQLYHYNELCEFKRNVMEGKKVVITSFFTGGFRKEFYTESESIKLLKQDIERLDSKIEIERAASESKTQQLEIAFKVDLFKNILLLRESPYHKKIGGIIYLLILLNMLTLLFIF